MFQNSKPILAGILLAASILICGQIKADEKNVIISRVGEHPTVGIPKAPVPISCFIDDESGELNFYFTGNLGNVAITVCELSLGIVASETVDSSLGTVQLYIPVTPGFYEITFVTAGGDIYTGTFTL
jgi:hypothetical protein